MSDKVLWGLWYAKDKDQPDGGRWYLDYFGQTCFSYDRRLVAAHAEARNARDEAVGRFTVCAVDSRGRSLPMTLPDCPICDLQLATLSELAAEEDLLLNGTGTGESIGILNLDDEPLPHVACSEIEEFNRDPVIAVDDDGGNVPVITDLYNRLTKQHKV